MWAHILKATYYGLLFALFGVQKEKFLSNLLWWFGGLVAKSCPILVTPWTVTCQSPLPMRFSRQEYWSGLPFPSSGDFPNSGTEPRCLALHVDSLPTDLWGKSLFIYLWRYTYWRASLVAHMVKNLPAVQEAWVQSLSWEDPLEEGMATHSSILAWRIPVGRGAWRATVHGVAQSRTRLSDLAQHTAQHTYQKRKQIEFLNKSVSNYSFLQCRQKMVPSPWPYFLRPVVITYVSHLSHVRHSIPRTEVVWTNGKFSWSSSLTLDTWIWSESGGSAWLLHSCPLSDTNGVSGPAVVSNSRVLQVP